MFVKGFLPVYIAKILQIDVSPYVIGLSAVIGHVFPIFNRFKGGKGVATFVGTLLAVDWTIGMTFGAGWLLSAILFRMSSLAALIGSLLAAGYAYQYGTSGIWITVCAMTAVIIIRHKENIVRIAQRKEPKIGKK